MPQKELPKAYEPGKYEDVIYKKWKESEYFNPDNLPVSQGVENYCIVMPPPNVTGVLHMGHASMLALEDILIRYHRLRGKRVLWLPGTDHAAIATQTKVEKILKAEGVSRHDLGREKFLKRVREFAKQSHNTIVGQVKKMGSSCDWSREAYTLDAVRTRAVRSVFKMMYDDGLIYRGERIVNWCPRCHSTLADDEVEYKTQVTKFYTFRYDKNFPFTIATTRPETKLGDTAVAVNPKDERYQKYIGQTFEVNFVGIPLKIKIIADRAVDMEFGTGALGVTPAHSVVDWQMAEENDLPIVKVINENGKIRNGFGEFSGRPTDQAREMIVKKLRAAGLLEKEEEIENNLSLCYRCGTPIEPLPSKQWFIAVNKPVKKFNGKTIKEVALEAVEKGLNGNPKKKINIYPQRFEKNYYHWLENLRDWCISRQIWFGHQIPVWYKRILSLTFRNYEIFNLIKQGKKIIETRTLNPEESERYFGNIKKGDEIIFNYKEGDEIIESLKIKVGKVKIYKNEKELLENERIENILPKKTKKDLIKFWHSIPDYKEKIKKYGLIAISIKEIQEIPKSEILNHKFNIYVGAEPPKGENWTQDPDTLDTWFSSGLWTFSALAHSPEQIKIDGGKLIIDSDDFRRFHPTAVLETGYDILFFWVARMIIMTSYAVGDIPFRDVYLHGLVLDEHGKKMSKSKGNVIDPLEMIKKYGTDATRLSLVIGSTPGNDLRLSEEKVAGFRNFTNKLWNIARYIITNYRIQSTDYQFTVENFSAADAWIFCKFQTLIKQVDKDLNIYKFSQAGEKLRDFTWGDLADWYLEISKFEKNSEKNKIIFHVLKNLLILWHPFIPFITEKIWQEMDKKNLLLIEKWPKETIIPNIGHEFEIIKNIIIAIRNARAEHKVEPARKIKAVIYAGSRFNLIKKNEILIKNLRTGIQELKTMEKGEKIKEAIFTTADEIEIYLLGAVDKEKEKTRLKKEITQLERAIIASKNKLSNKDFVDKAPEAIVAREREKLRNWRKELKILKERLQKL